MTTVATPISAEWLQILELGYAGVQTNSSSQHYCFHCATILTQFLKCSQCHVAVYCQKECQVQDWKKGGHKKYCAAYKRLSADMTLSTDSDQEQARHGLLQQIRMYAFPYSVHQSQSLGRGFLFVQSPFTLAALTVPKSTHGVAYARSVLLHYLTVGEYDAEVCREDFELTTVRSALQKAVLDYDEHQQVVVLMRFRCGHVALAVVELGLDYGLCRQLGNEYYQNVTAGALELRLDDE